MGRLEFILDDRMDSEFRTKVFQQKGMRHGNIAKALREAVKDWIEKKQ